MSDTRGKSDLINSLSDNLEPVEVMENPYIRSVKCMLLSSIFVVICFAVIGIRGDFLVKMGQSSYVLELAVSVISFALSSIAACHLVTPDCYQRRYIAWFPVASFAVLSLLILYNLLFPSADNVARTDNGVMCMVDMLLFAIWPIVTVIYGTRKAVTTKRELAGFCLGLSGVSIAYMCLRVVEPNDDYMHILLWHYIPMVAVVGCGVFFAKLLLRWQRNYIL